MRFVLFINLLLLPSLLWAADAPVCNSAINSVNRLINWREEMNCGELAVGEKKIVTPSSVHAPPKNHTRYILTRTGQNQYQVDIPVHLYESSALGTFSMFGLKSSATNTEEKMRTRIAECTKEYKDAFRGPNGEKLILNPITQTSNKDPLILEDATTFIGISTTPGYHTHSRKYDQNEDCASIMHELLHLMGLSDEYISEFPALFGRQKLHNCRVEGPENSIMNNHIVAGHQSLAYKFDLETCFIMEGSEEIKVCHRGDKYSNHANVLDDPEMKDSSNWTGRELNYLDGKKERTGKVKKVSFISHKRENSGKSLLYPAHFRAILYPGCQKKNSLYYKCTAGAKSTTYFKSCDRPAECLKGDWLK